MNNSNYFQIIFSTISVIFLLTLTNTSYADNNAETVKNAFQAINKALYAIEETKNFCSANFTEHGERNTEAFEQWELQYNFFLREFDKSYSKWKLGFSELEQQQFASLEFVQRQLIQNEIEQEYSEGGKDKCYNFKPSLTRPRNNLELTFQDDFNLIRNQSMSNFNNAHREGAGAHSLCVWEQQAAIKIATTRSEGKDIKFQKNQLKELKKVKVDGLGKDENTSRVKHYAEMIKEIYETPSLQALSFSQYRFALCEREQNNINSMSFKKAHPLLLGCQNQSAEYSDLLGQCINKALNDK